MTHLHETTDVLIDGEMVAVDIKILPVVEWLNSYESVKTLFSCEGQDTPRRPGYVLFTCDDPADLRKIIIKLTPRVSQFRLHRFSEVRVDVRPDKHGDWTDEFRYMIEFGFTELRDSFVHYLGTSEVLVPRKRRPPPSIRHKFHEVWSACVDTPGYNKQTWRDAEKQLYQAGHDA